MQAWKKTFYEQFGVPEVGFASCDILVPEPLQQVIATFGKQDFTVGQAAEAAGCTMMEMTHLLDFGWHREILDKAVAHSAEGAERPLPGRYIAGDYYRMLSGVAVYDRPLWKSVPETQRQQILQWNYREFIVRNLDAIRAGSRCEGAHTLEQALADFGALQEDRHVFFVLPCDCKMLAGGCGLPTDVCLRVLTEKEASSVNSVVSRGHGTVLSKAAFLERIKKCSKDGLMHTYMPQQLSSMCNCCGDCCFEFNGHRVLQEMGYSDVEYPVRFNVAVYDASKCVGCGICARRCHFQAFTCEKRKVQFDASKCFGCGLCAETCPKGCITMRKIKE